jgi:outer membrane protein OmpA-like peptidoglycan-associated protein
MPIYRVTVVARTMKAINYNHRSGATRIDFIGTALLPKARGEAKVESKQGAISIGVEFRELQPATAYGPEYLTYVMWAITPEGRAMNLGEVLLNGTNSKLNVTTDLQSFGLIVTAEPYFAVTQPSDVVVMENMVRKDTVGTIEELDAKYELLQRGQYTLNVNPTEIKPMRLDPRTPLELYEARNAVQIARWTGAERYAGDTFLKAKQGLENAEGYLHGKAGKKPIGTVAREAVQMAEDARIITVKKMQEETLASERQSGVARATRSEAARQSAADSQLRAEGERAAAQSETDRTRRDAEAARATAQSEADRMRREGDAQRSAAQADMERAGREKADTEAARAAAVLAQQSAQAETDKARLAAGEADQLRQKAEAEKAELVTARAAAQSEADRLKRETDAQRLVAQSDMERAGREKADAEAARAAAVLAQQAAQAETDKARLAVGEADQLRLKAEAEKTELRAQLLKQFSLILETRDTARGLIVNMSDVLFDTGKFSLRPGAREKLARVAGIISGHPGLKLEVEGHTDNVGGDEYNQTLSEHRGTAVRDYLTNAGIPSASVTTEGFGKTKPVASNDTAAGRQQNRRVELVVSGEIIGGRIGTPRASR